MLQMFTQTTNRSVMERESKERNQRKRSRWCPDVEDSWGKMSSSWSLDRFFQVYKFLCTHSEICGVNTAIFHVFAKRLWWTLICNVKKYFVFVCNFYAPHRSRRGIKLLLIFWTYLNIICRWWNCSVAFFMFT